MRARLEGWPQHCRFTTSEGVHTPHCFAPHRVGVGDGWRGASVIISSHHQSCYHKSRSFITQQRCCYPTTMVIIAVITSHITIIISIFLVIVTAIVLTIVVVFARPAVRPKSTGCSHNFTSNTFCAETTTCCWISLLPKSITLATETNLVSIYLTIQ